jgi:hypothetical protein
MATNDAAEAVERLRDPPPPFEEAIDLVRLWHAHDPNISIRDMSAEIVNRTSDRTDVAVVNFLKEKIEALRRARIQYTINQLGLDEVEKRFELERISVFGRGGT